MTMAQDMSSNRKERELRFIPLSYNNADSQTSAMRLILVLRPDWETTPGPVEFIRFTDGITNTLLKAIKKSPGLTDKQIDEDAILLRAYGNNTDVLIDRDRETASHMLLAKHGLAPQLLARCQNGLLYKFIRGRVTSPSDLRRKTIWRAVAARLAQWHAAVPTTYASSPNLFSLKSPFTSKPAQTKEAKHKIANAAPGKEAPNIWTVMQKWILALPTSTRSEIEKQSTLQKELDRIIKEFAYRPGLGRHGLIFGHCDLLSGNVIIHPRQNSQINGHSDHESEVVSFIDYEYATPSPAAFDIANHFAEWGGFDCDFSVLPSRSQRRDFLNSYLQSYHAHLGKENLPQHCHQNGSASPHRGVMTTASKPDDLDALLAEVDAFRGIPGFYWGIWALIQATISQIDFDYASYAEVRLGEYWAWRAEQSGERAAQNLEMPLRERRWAEE